MVTAKEAAVQKAAVSSDAAAKSNAVTFRVALGTEHCFDEQRVRLTEGGGANI